MQEPLTQTGMEKLLSQQTGVILDAVDKKIGSLDTKVNSLSVDVKELDFRITALEKRIGAMEVRFNQKMDRLITTLDKFLKRLTDTEDEFAIMKLDVNRMKKVIREKLGVDLS